MGRKPTGKPPGRPKGMPRWARVEQAREALTDQATNAVKLVALAARVAAKKGNHAPAVWMLEHIAEKTDAGAEVRPLASGIDRQIVQDGNRAPTINIGWIIGGAPERKSLEPARHVIDVTAEPTD